MTNLKGFSLLICMVSYKLKGNLREMIKIYKFSLQVYLIIFHMVTKLENYIIIRLRSAELKLRFRAFYRSFQNNTYMAIRFLNFKNIPTALTKKILFSNRTSSG